MCRSLIGSELHRDHRGSHAGGSRAGQEPFEGERKLRRERTLLCALGTIAELATGARRIRAAGLTLPSTGERALYYARGDNNDHDAAVWTGPGGLDPMLEPRDFFAQHPQGSRYAIP